MRATTLETPAWLMTGVITVNAKLGTLRLDHGRRSFRETGAEAAGFDLALADVRNVRCPFCNVGAVTPGRAP